ncbi:hypothetical protein H4O14_02430 [Bacillus sp. PAMC26568]|nr:hypothetical protein H4O14_02430 [Bacillus sp. PAMC26568]
MRIEKWLHYAGITLIAIGIIAGLSGIATMDNESYKSAKQVYEELPDNEIAAATYNAAKNIRLREISFILASLLGSVIGGLVLMGLSKMIMIQDKISDKLDSIQYNQKFKSE